MRRRPCRAVLASSRAALVLAVSVLASACGGGGGPSLAPVPPLQASSDPFDATILHYVEFEVAETHLPTLVPFGDERVPARLTFDGVVLEDVGVRLKGGTGSARPIGEKASFSVKTNEFVRGQRLHGVKRFTLDNEVQDPSLVAAHVGYELFRRAGHPARRTAFARVSFNGTYYGVYLVAEQIDGDFVSRWFADDEGNLYEGEHADVTAPEAMQLETNEDADDRADLEALRDLLLGADDATMLAALPAHVDLDAFLRYAACEALGDHWDSYTGRHSPFPTVAPNNYYVYRDPLRGLVWVPHGIDQLFGRLAASVLAAPLGRAVPAARLHATPEGRAGFAAAVRAVLDDAWDAAVLLARLEAVLPLIEGSVPSGVRGNPSVDAWRRAVNGVRDFLARREDVVRAELDAAGV